VSTKEEKAKEAFVEAAEDLAEVVTCPHQSPKPETLKRYEDRFHAAWIYLQSVKRDQTRSH
jgi:hypothetical protein